MLTFSRHPFYALLLATAISLSACDSNDPGRPGIDGDTLQVEGGRGTDVQIPLTLRAEAGIQSLTVSVDGDTPQPVDVDAGATEQQLTYVFTIPASATLGTEFVLLFTLTDQAGAETQITARVVTGKLIETPETYTFTRNGASTVSFPGQTDRLNMLQEMKAYLTQGDRGELLSEQALLDMFENTGGNGGGHFSFTSDRQLKDKTFPPDLDARLFENLFARAAAASERGQAGITASNGTAGLLVRENSGNTILVDENGREFTQLIEKGLMGAVFYNQIYNVYLTDSRVGNGVENVELVEGENYTPMEHHWDEAFGYWNAPPDFTSPWPEARRGELRFWSHYSNVVDNVAGGLLGTNKILMDAYKEGRAAIVNNDPVTRDAQRDVLYAYHELVAAATAVHYINLTLGYLDEGKTGEAFHTLSEAWAFVNALKYSPRRKISLEQIETIKEEKFGAGGNFWNVTSAGLNEAKATLVEIYPELAPVQDDL
ncbi:MAG: hypothetical protein KatS3mg043_0945 [Rhodothermaceae bacterium]|nr:MAG: hypothetical protein KatS3mg043_0945 [Rhodothermaceae bacterium]